MQDQSPFEAEARYLISSLLASVQLLEELLGSRAFADDGQVFEHGGRGGQSFARLVVAADREQCFGERQIGAGPIEPRPEPRETVARTLEKRDGLVDVSRRERG